MYCKTVSATKKLNRAHKRNVLRQRIVPEVLDRSGTVQFSFPVLNMSRQISFIHLKISPIPHHYQLTQKNWIKTPDTNVVYIFTSDTISKHKT